MKILRQLKNLIETNHFLSLCFDLIASTRIYQKFIKTKIDQSIIDLKKNKNYNIIIETTNFCNAKCIMCPHTSMKRSQKIMDDKTFNKIITQLETEKINPQAFIDAITGNYEKYEFKKVKSKKSSNMLEIPLFDMHWGISYREDYEQTLQDLVLLIRSKNWDYIVIPFGQDYFHNDSIVNGQTTKGTAIQKVDTVKAVQDGKNFMFNLIEECMSNANHVKVVYTPGNHDYSLSWMFIEVLLERYGPEIIDDSISNRKFITYGQNAIMITHGASKRALNPKDLALIFTSKFNDFSKFQNKEVHAGHLHSETDSDVYGVMVRRLSTKALEDDWSDKEDFVGSNKRFMLFEWSLLKLKSIYYV